MNYTVAARDHLTVRAEGDCMSYLEVVADAQNEWFVKHRGELVKFYADLAMFGQAEMRIEP